PVLTTQEQSCLTRRIREHHSREPKGQPIERLVGFVTAATAAVALGGRKCRRVVVVTAVREMVSLAREGTATEPQQGSFAWSKAPDPQRELRDLVGTPPRVETAPTARAGGRWVGTAPTADRCRRRSR